ncbi:MAG: FG-GAP-like repeat-containing protein [Verrucomicrobiales bacterium]
MAVLSGFTSCPAEDVDEPPLDIELLPTQQVELSWPALDPAAVLESAPGLEDPWAWFPETGEPELEGDTYRWRTTPRDDRFFRLRYTTENRPPTLRVDGERTVPLGSTLILDLVATDPEADPRTFFAEPLPLPAGARLLVSERRFEFRPGAAQIGTHTVTFGVSDGILVTKVTAMLTVTAPQPGGGTSLSGIVLDTTDAVAGSDRPVPGVRVSLLGHLAVAVTGADGRFVLGGIPGGWQVLDLDTANAGLAPDGSPYAGFREEIELIQAAPNNVPRPFYLPRVDRTSLTDIDPERTTTVVNPNLGVSLTVAPHTAKWGAEDFDGQLSISLVPESLAPAALPEDLGFGFLITLQPVGVTFSTPAPITMPNVDGIPPGSELDIWSLDAGTGRFVVVGRGRVTPDGRSIVTISGGIRATDWHSILPPPPVGGGSGNSGGKKSCADCPRETRETGSRTTVHDGTLMVDHSFPSYRSLNTEQARRLIYHSHLADARHVMTADVTLPPGTALPQQVSSRLMVAGIDQGQPHHVRLAGIAVGDTVRQAHPFDGQSWSSGVYPYSFVLTSHFPASFVAARFSGQLLHDNRHDSPFGVGWSLEGWAHLHRQPDGGVLIAEGDGGTTYFRAQTSGTGRFDSPPVAVIGRVGAAVAAADFDGDGDLDLVGATVGGSMTVALNDGSGAFPTQLPANPGVGVFVLAAGEFDGDGRVDLIAGGNALVLMKGNGNGTFAASRFIFNNAGAVGLFAGDLDGNGTLDLLAPHRGNAQLNVLLGDGSGNFTPSATLTTGNNPWSVTAADLNGDARQDLITANFLAHTLSIHLANPAGGYLPGLTVPTGLRPAAVTAGEYTGDSHVDLAVVHSGEDSCLILRGAGDGSFTVYQRLTPGPTSAHMIAADLTGDGRADLAIANQSASGDDQFALLEGLTSGGFRAPTAFQSGLLPAVLVALDADRDGDLDLAVGRSSGHILLHANRGGGEFVDHRRSTRVATSPDVIRTGDVNGDGHPDVVVNANGANVSIATLLGDGTGALQTPIPSPPGSQSTDVQLADFDQDGMLDALVVTPGGHLRVLGGGGNGSFQLRSTIQAGFNAQRAAVADFNRDGYPDIAAIAGTSGSGITVMLARGNGTFETPRPVVAGTWPYALIADDFTGDGAPDLAVINRTANDQNLYLLAGNGDGAFSILAKSLVGTAGPALAAFDMDGDGDVDFAVPREDGQVAVLLADGAGAFSTQLVAMYSLGDDPRSIMAADFNGDRRGDLAVLLRNTATLALSFQEEGGGFSSPVPYDGGKQPRALSQADFDGNGVVDLAAADTVEGDVNVFLGLARPGVNGWLTPPGEFAQLTALPNGGYLRRHKNRTADTFNAQGLQLDSIDANGNRTQFAYDTETRLVRLTDPVGLVTTFTYGGERIGRINDPFSRTMELGYSAAGDLVRIEDPDLSARSFTYDARHRLISQTSKRGFLTHYVYNHAGQNVSARLPNGAIRRVTPTLATGLADPASGLGTESAPAAPVKTADVQASFTDGLGHTTLYRTMPSGAATEIIDPLGAITRLQVNRHSQRTRVTNPNGMATVLTYDAAGNLTARRDAAGTPLERVHRLVYSPDHNDLLEYRDPLGGLTQFRYDANGNRTRITDPAGGVQFFIYESRGLLASSTDANGRLTRYSYNPSGNRIRLDDPAGFTELYDLHSSGLVAMVTEAAGTPDQRSTQFVYDTMNRLTRRREFGRDVVWQWQYDAEGNTTSFRNGAGDVSRYTYDALNRVTLVDLPSAGLTSYSYDVEGRLIVSVDAEGRTTVFDHDARGDLIRATNGTGASHTLERDALGNVIRVADAGGGVTTFEYDLLGQPVKQTNPLGGTYTHAYDALGRLTTRVDALGRTRTDAYDAVDRLTRRTSVDDQIDFSYDPVGNLTRVEDGDSAAEIGYDPLNRRISERTLPKGGRPDVTVTRVFDGIGKRTRLTDTTGGAVDYAYADRERLSSISLPAGAGVIQFQYDTGGRPIEITRPNGLVTTRNYASSRIVRITHQRGATTIGSLNYTYDRSGQFAKVTEPSIPDREFTYDQARQLTRAGTAAAPETYAYSPAGNRTASHLSAFHRHNAMSQPLEDDTFAYAYDANGNLTSKTRKSDGAVTSFAYDAFDQLVQVTLPGGATVACRYDGLGRRIESASDADLRRILYDGMNRYLEFDGANTLRARTIFGDDIDQPLATQRDGQWFHLLADHLGSIRWTTDAAGAVSQSITYDSFGNPSPATGPTLTPFGFTGREWDAETGLWFFRSRSYDPRSGSFFSPDPIGFHSGDLNLYRYVRNDPVNHIDPTGAEPITVGAVVLGGAAWVGSKIAKWWFKREASEAIRQSATESAARVRKALAENDTAFLNQFTKEQLDQILDAERTANGACIVDAAQLARTIPGSTIGGTPPTNAGEIIAGGVQDFVFDSPAAKPPP